MFQRIHSVYGVIGVMFFLVAMYLVLVNSAGTLSLLTGGSSAATSVLKTLQGR